MKIVHVTTDRFTDAEPWQYIDAVLSNLISSDGALSPGIRTDRIAYENPATTPSAARETA
jgi:hypothetical protein